MLSQAFPNKDLNIDIAWPILRDLSDSEFERAVVKIISERVEIYPNTNMLALIREKARIEKRITAGEAWGKVLKEIRRVGYAGNPEFNDELIELAVKSVGWDVICKSNNIGVERAHFLKVYEAFVKRVSEDSVMIPLTRTTPLISNVM